MTADSLSVLMLSLEYSSNVGGGVGTHVRELSTGLALAGDRVTVLSGTVGQFHRSFEENRRVYLVPPDQNQRPDRSMVQGVLDYNDTIANYARQIISRGEITPDLVHCHNWITYPAAVAVSDMLGIPVIVTIHYVSQPIERWWGQTPDPEILRQEEQLFRDRRPFIAVSQSIRSLMLEHYYVPEDQVAVIYNAVDPQFSSPSSLLDEHRDRLKGAVAPAGEKIAVFTGRFHPMKGISALLESAAIVLQQEPQVRYVMAGDPDSKAFAIEVRDLFDRYPIVKRNVTLLGKLSRQHVARLYSVADIALLPSVYDPCPYAAIEAMVAGVPLIASDGGGLAELVDDGITGVRVPVRIQDTGIRSVDPQELANATLLLLRDGDLAHKLGEASRQKAARAYTVPVMVEATRATYRDALNR